MQQQQSQRQQQKINPQQVQFLNFLQLSRQEIEQTLREELETNPFLEKTEEAQLESDDFDKDMSAEDKDTYQDEDTYVEVGINDAKIQREYKDLMHLNRSHEDFRKRLKNDVALFSSDKRMVAFAEYLIDCLDNDGILPESTEDIADNLSFSFQKLVTEVEIVKALELVQKCEPPGIGARSLQECLLIQIDRNKTKKRADAWAYAIIEDCFDDLCKGNLEAIQLKAELTADQVKAALRAIKQYSPKPIISDEEETFTKNTIQPDFRITITPTGKIEAELLSSFSGAIVLSEEMMQHMAALNKKEKSAKSAQSSLKLMKHKMESAEWVLQCLAEREHSMQLVISCICKMQKAFFEDGDRTILKPMILEDIADMSGLHISTISRITSSRYAETDFGTISLKELFVKGISNEVGEVVSNSKIKSELQLIISDENKIKPLSDEEIVKILAARQVKLARRTVAKYRDMLHIPAAKERARDNRMNS